MSWKTWLTTVYAIVQLNLTQKMYLRSMNDLYISMINKKTFSGIIYETIKISIRNI